jgi:hypothetical protein
VSLGDQECGKCGWETYGGECVACKLKEVTKALLALKLSGNCWCEMAIGNPMVTRHSDACLLAQRALNALPQSLP